MVKISHFYENTNIFITGATGFLGKALVEKLLRSCDGIHSVYLLIREKKGKTAEQRLEDFCKNPIFDIIKKKNPQALDKIKVILGDISLTNLGICDQDRSILIENTDIVIHSAATIRFDEMLKTAVNLNVFGTQHILQLCKEMKHLKSFVYVSTAYSNADKDEIDEIVYKPPREMERIVDDINFISNDEIDEMIKGAWNKHPNTYTITKAMAERIVLDNSDVIPSAIVRPSIVIAAWKEPYPGWTDSVSGCNGVSMECGRGMIKCILCDGNCIADLIPVDIVINTIITSAWHTVAERSNVMRVYNCISGTINPITWTRVKELIMKYSRQYPSKYVTWYPDLTYRMNMYTYAFYVFLHHTLPALLLDVYLYSTNRKPIVSKLVKKIDALMEGFRLFLTHQWIYKTSNMLSLVEAVKQSEDCSVFEVDVSGIDWDVFWKDYTIGIRKWLLKDEISSLPNAKVKLNRLYWIQKIYHIALAAIVIGILFFMTKYF